MEIKNFKVDYQINNDPYTLVFHIKGSINNETIRISAKNQIKKKHPYVSNEKISIISIEEINVW
jgi:hypothetical protein